MRNTDAIKWYAKNKKLNENVELTLGTRVKDVHGYKGVVVQIYNDGNGEGSVSVWQEDRTSYGLDNCEHYHYSQWKELLRILK